MTCQTFSGHATQFTVSRGAASCPQTVPDRAKGIKDETPPLTKCSDEELLTLSCQGRTEAFGVLVKRYDRELYRYLRRYLGDGSLAEDVFQNTFLQLYIKRDLYEQGLPVRPWLYTIATHQAVNALRRNCRHKAVSLDRAREEGPDGSIDSFLEPCASRAEGPLDLVEQEDHCHWVQAGVDRLPDFLRQVVVLAYYQGLKCREIAAILHIPVGTVKSRLHKALIRLREVWSAAPNFAEI